MLLLGNLVLIVVFVVIHVVKLPLTTSAKVPGSFFYPFFNFFFTQD